MSATYKRPCPDNSSDNSSDSDGDCAVLRPDLVGGGGGGPNDGPKPGKKTKGRVKIKMEFIENKLRRYTTFSKRKTGIMKKAYELSTLTGTQVMLLVASETGHVYTFATRKLQPMITSESGKALIQTCLNSPDSPSDQVTGDQRMNPTGYEETELSYVVSDDEQTCQLPPSSVTPPRVNSDKHVMMSSNNNNNNKDNNNSSCRSNHLSTNHALVTPSSSSASSSSSSSSSSSAQQRLLYQLSQESVCLQQNPSQELLRVKEETPSVAAASSSVSRSEGHGGGQSRSREGQAAAVNGAMSTTAAAAAAASSPANAASSSSSLTSSPAMVPRALPTAAAAAAAASGVSTGHPPSGQPQHQPTFYRIPGTNQIISVSFTGGSGGGGGGGGTGGLFSQTYTAPSNARSTQDGFPLPSSSFPSAPELQVNSVQQQFITVPIPISLSNANPAMLAHAQQLLSRPIKSEFLPTDLRQNSLERNGRV